MGENNAFLIYNEINLKIVVCIFFFLQKNKIQMFLLWFAHFFFFFHSLIFRRFCFESHETEPYSHSNRERRLTTLFEEDE